MSFTSLMNRDLALRALVDVVAQGSCRIEQITEHLAALLPFAVAPVDVSVHVALVFIYS